MIRAGPNLPLRLRLRLRRRTDGRGTHGGARWGSPPVRPLFPSSSLPLAHEHTQGLWFTSFTIHPAFRHGDTETPHRGYGFPPLRSARRFGNNLRVHARARAYAAHVRTRPRARARASPAYAHMRARPAHVRAPRTRARRGTRRSSCHPGPGSAPPSGPPQRSERHAARTCRHDPHPAHRSGEARDAPTAAPARTYPTSLGKSPSRAGQRSAVAFAPPGTASLASTVVRSRTRHRTVIAERTQPGGCRRAGPHARRRGPGRARPRGGASRNRARAFASRTALHGPVSWSGGRGRFGPDSPATLSPSTERGRVRAGQAPARLAPPRRRKGPKPDRPPRSGLVVRPGEPFRARPVPTPPPASGNRRHGASSAARRAHNDRPALAPVTGAGSHTRPGASRRTDGHTANLHTVRPVRRPGPDGCNTRTGPGHRARRLLPRGRPLLTKRLVAGATAARLEQGTPPRRVLLPQPPQERRFGADPYRPTAALGKPPSRACQHRCVVARDPLVPAPGEVPVAGEHRGRTRRTGPARHAVPDPFADGTRLQPYGPTRSGLVASPGKPFRAGPVPPHHCPQEIDATALPAPSDGRTVLASRRTHRLARRREWTRRPYRAGKRTHCTASHAGVAVVNPALGHSQRQQDAPRPRGQAFAPRPAPPPAHCRSRTPQGPWRAYRPATRKRDDVHTDPPGAGPRHRLRKRGHAKSCSALARRIRANPRAHHGDAHAVAKGWVAHVPRGSRPEPGTRCTSNAKALRHGPGRDARDRECTSAAPRHSAASRSTGTPAAPPQGTTERSGLLCGPPGAGRLPGSRAQDSRTARTRPARGLRRPDKVIPRADPARPATGHAGARAPKHANTGLRTLQRHAQGQTRHGPHTRRAGTRVPGTATSMPPTHDGPGTATAQAGPPRTPGPVGCNTRTGPGHRARRLLPRGRPGAKTRRKDTGEAPPPSRAARASHECRVAARATHSGAAHARHEDFAALGGGTQGQAKCQPPRGTHRSMPPTHDDPGTATA